MMDKTTEVLRAARKLIERPENWGQGSVGRRRGDGTMCALQALCAVSDIDYQKSTIENVPGAKQLAATIGGPVNCFVITLFNDRHTHAEVLAMFDKAIGPRTDISALEALLNPGTAMTATEVEHDQRERETI